MHFKSFLLQTKNNVNKVILCCKFIYISFFFVFFNVNKDTMLCRGVLITILQTNYTIYSHGGEWRGAKCFLLPRGGVTENN